VLSLRSGAAGFTRVRMTFGRPHRVASPRRPCPRLCWSAPSFRLRLPSRPVGFRLERRRGGAFPLKSAALSRRTPTDDFTSSDTATPRRPIKRPSLSERPVSYQGRQDYLAVFPVFGVLVFAAVFVRAAFAGFFVAAFLAMMMSSCCAVERDSLRQHKNDHNCGRPSNLFTTDRPRRRREIFHSSHSDQGRKNPGGPNQQAPKAPWQNGI
jgi:hypothetical protein